MFEESLIRRGYTYQYHYDEDERLASFTICLDEDDGIEADVYFSNLREIEIAILDFSLAKEKERLLIKMMDPSIMGAGLKYLIPSIEFLEDDIDSISDDSKELEDLPGKYTVILEHIYKVPEGYSNKQISEYLMGELLPELLDEVISVVKFFTKNGVGITTK